MGLHARNPAGVDGLLLPLFLFSRFFSACSLSIVSFYLCIFVFVVFLPSFLFPRAPTVDPFFLFCSTILISLFSRIVHIPYLGLLAVHKIDVMLHKAKSYLFPFCQLRSFILYIFFPHSFCLVLFVFYTLHVDHAI